jgi:hypothetical protein
MTNFAQAVLSSADFVEGIINSPNTSLIEESLPTSSNVSLPLMNDSFTTENNYENAISSSQSQQSLLSVESLNYIDSIYNVTPIINNNKSYIVDQITITPKELSAIKLNNICELMRKEILQYRIGQWTNESPSSIWLNLPASNVEVKCTSETNGSSCGYCNQISSQVYKNNEITLDKLTFQIEGSNSNQIYLLKNNWPINGIDLPIKAEDGLRIRSLLGLSTDQEIKILTNKELVDTPKSSHQSLLSSSTTGIESGISSMINTELFYRTPNISRSTHSTLFSQEVTPNYFTVEEYHNILRIRETYLNKPLPLTPVTTTSESVLNLNKPLPLEPVLSAVDISPRHFYIRQMAHIQGIILNHSTIFEGSIESLQNSSQSRSSILSTSSLNSNDPYAFSPNYEFRSEVYNLMTEADRNEVDIINLNSNLSRTNTSDTTETLVNPIPRQRTLEDTSDSNSRILYQSNVDQTVGLLERSFRVSYSDLGYHYRSNSIVESPRPSSPVNTLGTNLQDDID